MQIVDKESIFINTAYLTEESDQKGCYIDFSDKFDIQKYNWCAITNWSVKKNDELINKPDIINLRCDAVTSEIESTVSNDYGDILASININNDNYVYSYDSTELMASMKRFSPKGRRIRFSFSNSLNEEIDLDQQCDFTFHLLKVDTQQYEKINVLLQVFGTFLDSIRG